MKTDAVISHITDWLHDYAANSRTQGFVVGVSGGIDSAVTSLLAAHTGRPTLCVEMPIHQPPAQDSRAQQHIEALKKDFSNVSSVRTDLTPLFDTFLTSMPTVVNEEERFLTLANTRARLRMTTLYYFAGLHNYLVAGTGNKVEDFGVGFYTKYGDGGVDISPLADLMKTEVYAVAAAMGVNQNILDAKPTDGLWGDDRSDKDQLGASYPELEWAMQFDEAGANESELSARHTEVLTIYRRLNAANLHKMQPIPVCEIPPALK